MKTYVINISSRPDRYYLMDQQLKEKLPDLQVVWTTEWEYNKVGGEITDEWLGENNFNLFNWVINDRKGIDYPTTWTPYERAAVTSWWSRATTKGEIGCTLSNWSIWNDSEGPMTILEDDAVFDKDMELKRDIEIDTLECLNEEWDLLYLGRVIQENDEEYITDNIVKPKFTYCTYGYVLSESGVKKIRKYNVQNAIIPADEFLTATYNPHPRRDVRNRFPPSLNAYALEPRILKQRYPIGTDSDTEK